MDRSTIDKQSVISFRTSFKALLIVRLRFMYEYLLLIKKNMLLSIRYVDQASGGITKKHPAFLLMCSFGASSCGSCARARVCTCCGTCDNVGK